MIKIIKNTIKSDFKLSGFELGILSFKIKD